VTVATSPTAYVCWTCGQALGRIEPTISVWVDDCRQCYHRTLTQAQLAVAMTAKPDGSVGVVGVVPRRIDGRPIPSAPAAALEG
jgi:DNA-directed RNA polymerase subunit RPC12/RpoP